MFQLNVSMLKKTNLIHRVLPAYVQPVCSAQLFCPKVGHFKLLSWLSNQVTYSQIDNEIIYF
jgi:hypothetical protein